MPDYLPDPSRLVNQTVQPTADFNSRQASPDDLGAGIGSALHGVANDLDEIAAQRERAAAIKKRDEEQLTNFNLQKSWMDFTAAQQQTMMEAATKVDKGAPNFTKNSTEAFDKASQEWFGKNVPADREMQAKWGAQIAEQRKQFSTGALRIELSERDSYYKNTTSTQLNQFANGIGAAPGQFEAYRQNGYNVIEQSGMSPADKDVLRKKWAADSADVLAQSLIVKDPGNFKRAIENSDPRFADLDAGKVRSLVGAADREQRQRALEAKQAANLSNQTFQNKLLLDIYDGKAGQADIDNARKGGMMKDAGDVFRAESTLKQREAEVGSADFVNRAMEIPNFPFNPYDPVQKKGVNSAVKAAGGSPLAAFQLWQKTGILGDTGATALRGGLVSTDPQRVSSAANLAGNMLAHNPNAFAGVEGREDIEKGAVTFNHYVDDLGMTREDAAQRVAQQNDPVYKAKLKVTEPELQDFQKNLRKSSAVNDLMSAKKDWLSGIAAGGQIRQSVASDYSELASDYYAQTGDAGAAKAYAAKKLSGLYGMSNGQLMKYPPEKAYPAMGDRPNHDYIYGQAAYDVKTATGKEVAPKDIVLTPLPVATSEAWRAGTRVPYHIHYFQDVDGQRVLQTLPRAAFVADPGEEAKRIVKDRSTKFENERLLHEELAKQPLISFGTN